ncbi:MAG: polysaccharide deacetylase family protein [Novosphingobium sp.]
MSERRIYDQPAAADFVRFKPGFGQRFILTIDAEEEFDWTRPLERTGHSVDSVPRLAKFQQFCEALGIVPLYLVDYPLATSAVAADILRGPLASGQAEIGVQLHPWVNPPFEETINEFNSFSGNLPPELERAKFMKLRDTIEANFGKPPLSYRAGRYGVGPNTVPILRDAGIAVDTSVRSRFDYSATGGPNFRDLPVVPWWIDKQQRLMEMPLTTVFWGLLRQQGHWLYPKMWRVPRMRGALARIGMLERIPLTPEGVSVTEAIRGIDIAVDDGLPLLVFSFHSPSLQPGHTPYVRTAEDLDAFYDWWRQVFAYLAQRNVQSTNIGEIMQSVELA